MQTERAKPSQTFNETAIETNRDLMLKRARSIVKNHADAEDVVQEALERAWKSRDGFIAGANPRPWLLRITTNAALDLVTAQRPVDRISQVFAFNPPSVQGIGNFGGLQFRVLDE
ncbi:MAG TPA: sigma factor, partial [Candidatus Baltobacteraceae bacterium]|nr:sigma factor [Candidatus Baltobacteraceae bacterium]